MESQVKVRGRTEQELVYTGDEWEGDIDDPVWEDMHTQKEKKKTMRKREEKVLEADEHSHCVSSVSLSRYKHS